jgi:hypothetical protein
MIQQVETDYQEIAGRSWNSHQFDQIQYISKRSALQTWFG